MRWWRVAFCSASSRNGLRGPFPLGAWYITRSAAARPLRLQSFEQVRMSSQQRSHFLRQQNDSPHTMHTFVGTEEAAISCALVWSAEVDGGCAHGISVGTMNDDVKGCAKESRMKAASAAQRKQFQKVESEATGRSC